MQSAVNIIATRNTNAGTWRWFKGKPCKCQKSRNNTVLSCGNKLTAWFRCLHWVWYILDGTENFWYMSGQSTLN